MKKSMAPRLAVMALISISPFLNASTDQLSVTRATWENTGKGNTIILDVRELLTVEQREIVKSGFSTFTLLAVAENRLKNDEAPPAMRLVCRVKYDTWEEKYHTTRIEPPPIQDYTGTKLDVWSKSCLVYKISEPEIINRLKSGGTLYATLQVRQSSQDESGKIKNWLVKQQSGFMQGLYSHMLGDLQLGGKVEILVDVPSLTTSEKTIKNQK